MKRAPSGILPLIAIDRKAAKALHRQIYDAYRTGIVSGGLRPPECWQANWEFRGSRF
jgi:hypothetical protein